MKKELLLLMKQTGDVDSETPRMKEIIEKYW